MVKATDTEKSTLKFLCSYGGKIVPRQTDGLLSYVGGHTRILAVDSSISFADLMVKLLEFCGSPVTLKCQLRNGDLEILITINSDEELALFLEEYDRDILLLPHPLKIRSVLSPPQFLKTVSPPPLTIQLKGLCLHCRAYKSPYKYSTTVGYNSIWKNPLEVPWRW